jgi:hypothetical protein
MRSLTFTIAVAFLVLASSARNSEGEAEHRADALLAQLLAAHEYRRAQIQTMEVDFTLIKKLDEGMPQRAIRKLEATKQARARLEMPMTEKEYQDLVRGYSHLVRVKKEQHRFVFDGQRQRWEIRGEADGRAAEHEVEYFDGLLKYIYFPEHNRATILKNAKQSIKPQLDPMEAPQWMYELGSVGAKIGALNGAVSVTQKDVMESRSWIFHIKQPSEGHPSQYLTINFDPVRRTILGYEWGSLLKQPPQPEEKLVPIQKFTARNIIEVSDGIYWPQQMEWTRYEYDQQEGTTHIVDTITLTYTKLRINAPVQEELLKFVLPLGTEVYDEIRNRAFIAGGIEGATEKLLEELKNAPH